MAAGLAAFAGLAALAAGGGGGAGTVAGVAPERSQPSVASPSAALSFARGIARRGPRPAGGARAARAAARRRALPRRRAAGLEPPVPCAGPRALAHVVGAREGRVGCLRVFTAHADSMPSTPGAEDNASGLGALVDLAGRLGRVKPPCEVWLVATGAEERLYTGRRDHLGALELAGSVRRSGPAPRLRYALSLDEVGSRSSFWLRSPVRRPRGAVEGELLGTARRLGVPVRWVRDRGTGNSDHREFELLGMRAAKLGVPGNPCRHSACDRPSRLRDRALRRAVRLAAALAAAR